MLTKQRYKTQSSSLFNAIKFYYGRFNTSNCKPSAFLGTQVPSGGETCMLMLAVELKNLGGRNCVILFTLMGWGLFKGYSVCKHIYTLRYNAL